METVLSSGTFAAGAIALPLGWVSADDAALLAWVVPLAGVAIAAVGLACDRLAPPRRFLYPRSQCPSQEPRRHAAEGDPRDSAAPPSRC